MARTLRVLLLAAIAAAVVSETAAAQAASTDSLLRRIERLERKTAEPEERLRQVEGKATAEGKTGRPPATSGNWRDIASWCRLKLGMGTEEVRAVLGEPTRVNAGLRTFWYWEQGSKTGHVYFMHEKVEGWSEP